MEKILVVKFGFNESIITASLKHTPKDGQFEETFDLVSLNIEGGDITDLCKCFAAAPGVSVHEFFRSLALNALFSTSETAH